MSRAFPVMSSLFRNSLWLLLLAIAVLVIRLPLLVQERQIVNSSSGDEWISYYVAQDLADGGTLYKTTWDHKGPIFFFILAPLIKLFGPDIFLLRLVGTLAVLLSMFLVYLTGRRLFDDAIGLLCSLLYGLFFNSLLAGGFTVKAELFMLLGVIIALYCFLGYLKGQGRAWLSLYCCGAAAAAAFFIKPTALFSLLVVPLGMAARKIVTPSYRWQRLAHDALLIIAGAASVTIPILLYLLSRQTLGNFFTAYGTFNWDYINCLSLSKRLSQGFSFLRTVTGQDLLTTLGAASILFIALRRRLNRSQLYLCAFLSVLLLGSLCGMVVPYYSNHYYLPMGIGLSLLVGFAVSLVELSAEMRNRIIAACILLAVVVAFSQGNLAQFMTYYRQMKDPRYNQVAEYVRSTTQVSDTVFCLGLPPEVNCIARRKAPTRYQCWVWFVWDRFQEGMKRLDANYWEDFVSHKPTVIVCRRNKFGFGRIDELLEQSYHAETRFGDTVVFRRNEP